MGRRIPNIPRWEQCSSPGPARRSAKSDPALARAPGPGAPAGLLAGLERSRERGYSVVLQSPGFQELRAASEPFTARQFTPAQERDLLRVLVSLGDLFEPDDQKLQGEAAVRMISAPVFGGTGKVELVLQIWDLPPELTEDDIRTYASRLTDAASTVTQLLAAADQDTSD